MAADRDELVANLAGLPNVVLLRIANASQNDYRQEAIDAARNELLSRGVELSEDLDISTHEPASPPLERESRYTNTGSRETTMRPMPGWWFWACLIAASLVLIVWFRESGFSRGKPSIYMMTLALDLLVLADLNRFFDWSNQDLYFRSKMGVLAAIAIGITIWSFLCVVNVVNY
jgi:hypothetical protein